MLISHCVQEEDRLKREMTKSAYLASTSQDKAKKRKKDKGKKKLQWGLHRIKHKRNKIQSLLILFYKKASHVKKDCPKYAK